MAAYWLQLSILASMVMMDLSWVPSTVTRNTAPTSGFPWNLELLALVSSTLYTPSVTSLGLSQPVPLQIHMVCPKDKTRYNLMADSVEVDEWACSLVL